MYVYVPHVCLMSEGKKRALDPLEPELYMVIN